MRNELWERWTRTSPEAERPVDINGLAHYLSVTVNHLAGKVERYPRTWNKHRDCWEYLPSEVMKVVLADSDAYKARRDATRVLHVYAIQCVENGLVKIGVSNEPQKRLAALMAQSPVDMLLLASTPGGYELERELHKRFAAHRQRGEWFRAHADILAWVDECRKR